MATNTFCGKDCFFSNLRLLRPHEFEAICGRFDRPFLRHYLFGGLSRWADDQGVVQNADMNKNSTLDSPARTQIQPNG
jgi:hypothetical protein